MWQPSASLKFINGDAFPSISGTERIFDRSHAERGSDPEQERGAVLTVMKLTG